MSDTLAERLIESLRDEALFALDASGCIIRWSAGAAGILGYDAAEAIGRHVSVFYPDDEVQLDAVSRELRGAETDGRFEAEVWQVRRAGERFRAHVSTAALRDDDGVLLGFARVVRDMTDRLRTEEALRFSEAKFSGIVSLASESIVSVDESQRIVLYNQGAEQVFGYTAEEAIGQPLNMLIPERHRGTHPEHVRQFAESPVVARRMGERGEIDIFGRRKNGEVFPAEASISKLEIGGRRLYTAVLRDITARQRADREREALLERERTARADAEASAQARDDVLRIVSHDLGNSLSAMLVNTRVLMKILPDEIWVEDARSRIESLRHLAEQMQRLRQDLLDVARIEAGQLSVVAERHHPAALIDAAWDDFAPLAEEKCIALIGQTDGALPLVSVDRDRILQVLANLIGNALRFTPEGGSIVIGARRENGAIRFTVADSGAGIEAADLPHIFDRFWQAKIAHRAGAGLGLAICKGIVEAHGGSMDVESDPGHGSTFSFTVPASEG